VTDKSSDVETAPKTGRRLHVPHVPPKLPVPSNQALLWGGLAVAAVVGVLEWPVAVAVAAGVWIAGRHRHSTQATSPSKN
jgi:hypothetical protein